ncbi:MAG: RHS repeat-associated core domain-containing protein, partial [Candidatus Thiodiazotropha endolucinida]
YNGLLQSYDYDLFGRLTRAETRLGSYRYTYDSLGNRTQKQHIDQNGNTTTQENHYPNTGEGNRLLSQDNGESKDYLYNPSGSPEQIGERYFEYDDHQRPVRLYRVDPEQPDNKTLVAAYTYNRFGERIKKVVYANTKQPKITYYLYDGHQLIAEADDSGKVTAQYLYQQQRPILKLEGKTTYAIHTDHLGAPRAVTDEDQQTVWSADYSPFGLIDIQTQEITLNLRLPGQYEDRESGTYYNYQRDYDPNTGRYLTSDPIGLKGGLNTYAYVGGNPLNTIDPLGLYWEIVNGIPQWVPDGPDGSTEPVNIFDLYPMPGTSEIDTGELTDYLSTLEREEYGDRLIDDFASTGAPDICIRDVNVPEEFQFGLGNLRGGTGLPGIIYGDTIDGVLAQYTDQPFNMGSIHGWVRNGNQLQLHYPGLSDTQVDVVGIAIGHLPAYGGERMHIAIPAGASDEQIAEELMMSLGSLLTHEDVVAFLANLPRDRDGPLLVDIYELYQEILARYQTRLHSDDRVWHAEIDANNAQGALAQHIQEYGETLDCSGRVQTTDAAVCQRRDILEREAEEAMERYIEALQTVNNEMIDNGLMPLMDEQMSNQSQAREMFAATTVAAVGIFVPLTLQDAAIDALTAGLGRIRRVGEALETMVRAVRGAGRAVLNRVRNVTDEAVERVINVRYADFDNLRQMDLDNIRQIELRLDGDPDKLRNLDQDLTNTEFSQAVQQNPDMVNAWDKLSDYPAAFRTDVTNLNQRNLLDEYADGIADASNARKGNFGEIGADLDLNSKGYESLQVRIDSIDSPGHNGIDGVYLKDGQYYIVEGKYTGSARLNPENPATGLPRQMSDQWIDNRLNDAVGTNVARDIRASGYERVLARVAPDGSVAYQLVNERGYVIPGNAGIFNP